MTHKQTEITKGVPTENLKVIAEQVNKKISDAQFEAAQEEQEARKLESKLFEAQLAEERKETAETKGKETKEKIEGTLEG